ncbi:MAG: pyridoxal-phosphate dependent enzyme, partial [Candidatus Bathyarchaeia archaeon]
MCLFADKPDEASKPLLDVYQRRIKKYSGKIKPLDTGSLHIGRTPVKDLSNFSSRSGLLILAKLEWFNPWGSVKDRVAWYMIGEAEERGELRRGERIIIEPSSGNTGIALTGIAMSLGYSVEVVVPDAVSDETKTILRGMGAKVWEVEDDLCPRVGRGTDQSISLAKAAVKSHPGKYFMPNQYENFDNVRAHYETTG